MEKELLIKGVAFPRFSENAEYDTVINTHSCNKGLWSLWNSQLELTFLECITFPTMRWSAKTTTKLCIVYDVSAKTNGLSLNNCLHHRPKFDQGILDILIRFRVHRVAITADTEKAFLLISLEPTDDKFLCFLWVDDPFKEVFKCCCVSIHQSGVWRLF